MAKEKEVKKEPTLEERRGSLAMSLEEAKAQAYRIEGALSVVEDLIKNQKS